MVKINKSEAVPDKQWDKASVSYGESWLRAFQRFSLNYALVDSHSVLDLGGDGSFVRSASRNDNLSVRSVDLHNSNADIKADLSNSLWAENDFGVVDIVVSNNLVEHLPNPHEFLRLLSEKFVAPTQLLIQVPVMIREHGSPQDFGRYLVDWWNYQLEELGFDELEIKKHGVGAITVSAAQLFSGTRLPSTVSFAILRICQRMDGVLAKRFYSSSDTFYLGLAIRATFPANKIQDS